MAGPLRIVAPPSLDELASHRCSVFRHPATGQTLPWYVNVDGALIQRHMPPTPASNDIELELQAALSGQVIAQVSAMSAAPFVRAGQLVPLLPQHMADQMRLYLYYGSRKSQPLRVRQFIELAVARLADNPRFVLSPKELGAVGAKATARRREA